MADLNIPNLNIKTDKYIFKKKLNLRRKSKRRLFTESFFLFILSVLLINFVREDLSNIDPVGFAGEATKTPFKLFFFISSEVG